MKKLLPPLLILLFIINSHAWTQNEEGLPPSAFELKPLSKEDQEALKKLPELTLPESYRKRDLPTVVDNSMQPYMRQVFQQSGLSCGQAAGIAYNFTYEIDRVRNLPANTNDNLYPTHFTWNWMHGGYGWYGVSYLHSFQILRHCGNVNVTDYGGSLAYGGSERWMTGYDNYHKGMENRINAIYRINVGTPEGLEVFKHWINDHHEGADVGGVGSFYSQYMAVATTLPPGTPEAGKHVLTYFGGSANHAQTIVGYHDSICWDYNGDGQYTNHIDINGDGVVNMKDWEIGGFKMVQSYGGVPNWGDQGYAYMMYKTVADNLGQGGIWNHSVHVLDVKESCEPQATMRVTLTHDNRNMIKVIAGLSNNISATAPHYILEYPIFNYQGGTQYMQGGTSNPANKTIEFGLDISPLLGVVSLGQDVRFFLQVFEYDPAGTGTGVINHFSVIDYTDGVQATVCPQNNVPVNNHDVTTMSLVANFDFDKVHIVNPALPPATVGQPYNHQLLAAGGHPPYHFTLHRQYEESVSAETFPMVNQYQLNPSNSSNGRVSRQLDFDFPYYDSVYSSVTVHVDGYLMFDEQLYPYPYFYDDMVLFRITRHISPFMCHAIRLYSYDGDGIWYEGDSTQATFRWKASIDGNVGSDINVAVRLFPSGDIDFFYGNINIGDNILWIPGLCDGNEDDMQFSEFYFDELPDPNSKYSYSRYSYLEWLSVSKEGLISGTPQQQISSEALTIKVTDNNFVYDFSTLLFSTSGIPIEDSVSSGGDEIIEYGEIALLSVTITNLEDESINNASMTIDISDPYINVLDNYEYIGTLPVGQSVQLINAFSFKVASDIPDEHLIEIETNISGSGQVWENLLLHFAYAPDISITDIFFNDDGNGIPDPGETADLQLRIFNDGGSKASQLHCLLLCQDPHITIHEDSVYLQVLRPDSASWLTYSITVSPDIPIGHELAFELKLDGNMGFEASLPFTLIAGLTVEDFETGDFNLFSWGFTGNRNWIINSQYPYEGSYCARSGSILHGQSSSMILDVNVLEEGNISFFRKVNCQGDGTGSSDHLAFFINDIEQARWDSILPWEEVIFPVGEGYNRFEWKYEKDASVSTGLDAAFIDYISLPSCLDAMPQLLIEPEAFDKAMKPDDTDTDTLFIDNPGEGEIMFTLMITSAKDHGQDGNRSIEGSYLECNQNSFFTGEPFNWSFVLYNGSEDDEWLTELTLKIPEGIIIESATNFTGGSGGPLAFTGGFGNGPLMRWYGEDASGWGVVYGGEFANGQFSGHIESGFTGNAVMDYVITGDMYGNEPHVVEGQISLTSMGGIVPWISADLYEGSVPGEQGQQIILTYDTEGMDDGHYYCNIIVSDNFQHETIIPVHLLVDTYLGISGRESESSRVQVFPNPFTDEIEIILEMPGEEEVSMRLLDIRGVERAVILDKTTVPAGKSSYRWQAAPDRVGSQGMYLLVVEYGGTRHVKKIIRSKK
jgi:hypothetical protein